VLADPSLMQAAHQPDHAWWRIVAQAPSRQQGGG
jgi:hypothetical protein